MLQVRSIIIILLLPVLLFAQTPEAFPRKGIVNAQVAFWKKVYTEIAGHQAFIHDNKNPKLIYMKVDLPHGRRSRTKKAKYWRNQVATAIRALGHNHPREKTPLEVSLSELLGKKSKREYYQLARQVRYQYGLKDHYYEGLVRSYRYMDYIKSVFTKLKLPAELAFLPHVESAFNYNAYSKVGASGIWQFMRKTARMYGLKINYAVDERRNVLKATLSAAKLLRDNHRQLGNWPLALTAYNHGPRSVKRAIKKLGTKELHTIIEQYDGYRFGFASKNFYATFLATVDISREPEKYFPGFLHPRPFLTSTLKLQAPATIYQVSKAVGINVSVLKSFNPSLRKSVFRNRLLLPSNLDIHIPRSLPATLKNYQEALAKIKRPRQTYGKLHILGPGETLYDVANSYGLSVNKLIQLNQTADPRKLQIGTKIYLPGHLKFQQKKKQMMAGNCLPLYYRHSEKMSPACFFEHLGRL